jgi:hypothetical protein
MLIGRAARLEASAQPILLVAGKVPSAASGLWAGAAPRVFPLSAMLAHDGANVVLDRAYLETAFGKGRQRKPAAPTASFPTPSGASWEDVQLSLADHRLTVRAGVVRKEFTFQEAGFEEKRRGNTPDRLWALLRVFALAGGVVPFDSPRLPLAQRTKLKQNVSQLGKRLRALLHIAGSPFKSTRKTRRYEARFRISTSEGLRFPTPAGTNWDAVSITEVREGAIEVAVDASQATVVYNGEGGGWEGAQDTSAVGQTYDLRHLGLTGEDGAPNEKGAALLAVLRASGKVQRAENDSGMLALCGFLSGLLQIKGRPFQFSLSRRTWSAHFEAGSLVRPGVGEK